MRPQDVLHLVGERGDALPGDEEGAHVEQVEEDLVAVAEGRAEVLVARAAARAQLLGTEHPLHQDHVVVCEGKRFFWSRKNTDGFLNMDA